ncbi:hypothetical protein GCM10028805_12660 [Spirosoma harenae]
MKTVLAFCASWLLLSGHILAQHTIYFKNGHSGRVSKVEFKEKTLLLKSFDNPRAPLQEIPKNTIERIVMEDGNVLVSTDINLRRSPTDQIALFIKQEAQRFAADDGSPRPVAYESSNFLGNGIILTRIRNDQKSTILTFVRRRSGGSEGRFIISSATYLYNRQDVRQAFRIMNAGKFDLDVPITIPTGVDSLQYDLYFERVSPEIQTINFKSIPIAAGLLGGPTGGYRIIGLSTVDLSTADLINASSETALAFGETKTHCITCGDIGTVRCPTCQGTKTITVTEQRQFGQPFKPFNTYTRTITCPACGSNGTYLCPNRPNHPEAP